MQVFDFLALVLVLVRLLVIRTFACVCACAAAAGAAAAAGSDRCCCAKQNCIMTVCVRAMLCWFFSGDFWLSGVMGVQSTAHYHIYIYTIIYTWTDLFWHILSQNWNTNLPGILMFNGKTKVFLSFFPSTDPLILKMGTLRSHFWICRFNDEGYYQYSSSNLLVLGREWMGCWGLLGWLLLVIMDHSRKFPCVQHQ